MIQVENQDHYKEAPLVLEFKNTVNPIDVLTGLINKGQGVAETVKGAADALGGDNVHTNIGGYDVTVNKDYEQPKKIWGIPKPIFIVGGITIGLVATYLVIKTISKKKQTS